MTQMSIYNNSILLWIHRHNCLYNVIRFVLIFWCMFNDRQCLYCQMYKVQHLLRQEQQFFRQLSTTNLPKEQQLCHYCPSGIVCGLSINGNGLIISGTCVESCSDSHCVSSGVENPSKTLFCQTCDISICSAATYTLEDLPLFLSMKQTQTQCINDTDCCGKDFSKCQTFPNNSLNKSFYKRCCRREGTYCQVDMDCCEGVCTTDNATNAQTQFSKCQPSTSSVSQNNTETLPSRLFDNLQSHSVPFIGTHPSQLIDSSNNLSPNESLLFHNTFNFNSSSSKKTHVNLRTTYDTINDTIRLYLTSETDNSEVKLPFHLNIEFGPMNHQLIPSYSQLDNPNHQLHHAANTSSSLLNLNNHLFKSPFNYMKVTRTNLTQSNLTSHHNINDSTKNDQDNTTDLLGQIHDETMSPLHPQNSTLSSPDVSVNNNVNNLIDLVKNMKKIADFLNTLSLTHSSNN